MSEAQSHRSDESVKQGKHSPSPLPRCSLAPQLLWHGLLLLLLTACGATVTPPPPVFVKAAGSTSMGPLMSDLAAAYHDRYPHVTFDLEGGGSQLGLMLVEAKQVDIGLVSGPPQNLAGELRLTPIARDAIAIILNAQNRIGGLSLPELRDIFSGRLLNWQEVGGRPGPIQVVSREDGSGTRAAFEAIVMENRAVIPTAIVLPNSRAVVDFVGQNPNAIAYVSFIFTHDQVYPVPVEGVAPTLESITSGSYPLTRELAVITLMQGRPEVDRFVNFVLSPAGQATVGARWGRVR